MNILLFTNNSNEKKIAKKKTNLNEREEAYKIFKTNTTLTMKLIYSKRNLLYNI